MKKEKQHGGKRKKAGRPTSKNPRQYFSAMISQETNVKIRQIKEKTGKSFGQIIDETFKTT